jgi:hypothetical protein
MRPLDSQVVIDSTRRWIAEIVIGLNLCPFARRVFDSSLIRYTATDVADPEELLGILKKELRHLVAAPRSEIETTLLIHPQALGDFLDYNDFLTESDDVVRSLRLRGIIQIASFHPRYQFKDTSPDDVVNYTNRSPFPMLHLLREASITEVADDPDFLAGIPERNIALMRKLGRDRLEAMIQPPGV